MKIIRNCLRSRLPTWIDALPPHHLSYGQREAFWRCYKLLPLIAGISIALLGNVEMIWFGVNLVLLIFTAIWIIGVFSLVTVSMAAGR
jgi:hypothetical protein